MAPIIRTQSFWVDANVLKLDYADSCHNSVKKNHRILYCDELILWDVNHASVKLLKIMLWLTRKFGKESKRQ